MSSNEISLVLIKIACLMEDSTTGISANVVPPTHKEAQQQRFVLNRSTKAYPFIVLSKLLAAWLAVERGRRRRHLWSENKGSLITHLYPQCAGSLCRVRSECPLLWLLKRRKSRSLLHQQPPSPQSLSAPRPRSLTQHQ